MALDAKDLLRLPAGRAAYSDRTAWLMAEMSDLAYLNFEGSAGALEEVVDKLAGLSDKEEIARELGKFEAILARPGDQRSKLEAELARGGFELVETFDSQGTQAFLAKSDPIQSDQNAPDKIAVLAFRGTEKNLQDIKTDLNARFYFRGNTRIHRGFLDAFEVVEQEVRDAASELEGYKLYITGHSLGGALAIIATRQLNSDSIAACYTFGSPKVGNSEFGDDIKPPIYRVVNAADMVPRVPPTWAIELVILLGKAVPIPWVRGFLVKLLTRFRGYRHTGDMRYLTACQPDFSDLRMIPNLNIIDRAARLVARLSMNWKSGASDHAIAQYSAKLKAHALQRLDKPT